MNSVRNIVDGGCGAALSPMAERILRWMMDNPNKLHHRDTIAEAVDCKKGGRAIDTYVAEIRKLCGNADCIVCGGRKAGYGWIGERVALIPVVWSQGKDRTRNEPMAHFAVMTRKEVARRLGCTVANVAAIEKQALDKLKKKPELIEAWKAMLEHRPRHTYDPYHEIWLYDVQEKIANPYNEEGPADET